MYVINVYIVACSFRKPVPKSEPKYKQFVKSHSDSKETLPMSKEIVRQLSEPGMYVSINVCLLKFRF